MTETDISIILVVFVVVVFSLAHLTHSVAELDIVFIY